MIFLHIAGHIAKKLNRRFGNCCKEFCVDDSPTTRRNTLRAVLPYHLYHLWNMSVMDFYYTDHGFDIICLLKLQERKATKLVLHKNTDHVTFLCQDYFRYFYFRFPS